MPLTQIEIRNAKPGMHAEGSGLYLAVKASGAKSWMYRYQIAGRRCEMGLGALSSLPAIQARAEAAKLKAIVRQGVDPLEAKAEEKRERDACAQAERDTKKLEEAIFRRVAKEHIARQEAGRSRCASHGRIGSRFEPALTRLVQRCFLLFSLYR